MEPEHVLAHMNMGNIYQGLKLTRGAEEAYKNTLKANPYYVFGALSLARLYIFRPSSIDKHSQLRNIRED